MKKKNILIYLISALIPVLIFLICSILNGYLPFGDEVLNAYDSYTQYPGFLLEYVRGLKVGNPFYSFGGSLGFNLFGTITYYAISPLNILAVFANPMNYPYFAVVMTYLRFALLGSSMCFYLSHKNFKPANIVLFSSLYSLMGFTSAYYYNYIWIDSIIMLPLVIHGLDSLLEGKNASFYIVSLTLAIMINYYIGYMICIFSLIWFLYRSSQIENKTGIFKTFILSSLLAGGMSACILLPSTFALLQGKSALFSTTEYFGFSKNALTFLYTLTTGSFQIGDQSNGPGLIYSSILVVVLTIMYFFNESFTKKEKIATIFVIAFFYLSLSVNLFNYAWQLFQSPIWWPSRFSFLISFFLIVLAARTFDSIEQVKLNNKKRTIIAIIMGIGFVLSAIYKWKSIDDVQLFTYFYLGFSVLLFLELMFLADKKGFVVMVLIFTFIEISVNTFNSLKTNYRYISVSNYHYLKQDIPTLIEKLNVENDGFFYRFELTKKFTSNDGLYFGYNGINYFNSVRNVKTIKLLENLGIKTYNDCHVNLLDFDPVTLSLLDVKYLYGNVDYLEEVDNKLFENPYSLGIGFMVLDDIKDFEFGDDPFYSKNNLVKTMSGIDIDLYEKKSIDLFDYEKVDYADTYSYRFKSKGHYLIFLENLGGQVVINDETRSIDEMFVEIQEGDDVEINYNIVTDYKEEDVYFTLLNLDSYERHMDSFENVLKAKINVNGHLLEGTVEVDEGKKYMYTSIPFEEGIRVSVDGNPIDIDVILGGFIGFELETGSHEITVDYTPKGLNFGVVISLLSLFGTVYLQKKKKAL